MEKEPIRVLHIVPNMQAGGLETLIMNIYRNIDTYHGCWYRQPLRNGN